MSYEDNLRQVLTAKADELADRSPSVETIMGAGRELATQTDPQPASQPWYRSSHAGAWTVAALASAAILVAAVFLAGSGDPDRVTTGPDFAQPAETTEVDGTVEVPTSAPAPADNSTAVPVAQAPPPEPAATLEPTPEPEPPSYAIALLPGNEWTVEYFSADVLPPMEHTNLPRYAAIDGDLFGPAINAYYLPQADYRRVGNPGGPYYDLTTPGGRTVRVRTDFAPAVLTAVVQQAVGSFVVISYDLTEDDLVAAIDAVEIVDGEVSFETALPAGLTPQPIIALDVTHTTYALRRTEQERIQITTVDPDIWQWVLTEREARPDAEPISGDGFRGIVYGGRVGGLDAGAALLTDDAIVIVYFQQSAPNSPPGTVDDARAVVQGFAQRDTEPIFDALGLQSRATVYGDWMEAIPLPADADLSWMLAGPPVSPAEDAFRAHQIFACTWVEQWIATGEPSALDQVEKSTEWPTAEILRETQDLEPSFYDSSLVEARTIEDLAGRERSALALDCSWLLGEVPID